LIANWSKKHISSFRNPGRALGRITVSRGQGRGSALGVVRLRPGRQAPDALRAQLRDLMDPGTLPGIISMNLVESDPELSRNLTNPDDPNPGAGDWYVLVDGTELAAVRALMQTRFKDAGAPVVSMGTYRLMWDLSKSDL
jgi:hypothetical protein